MVSWVIVGATRGIGFEYVKQLVHQGAHEMQHEASQADLST
jgi:NAD(P)-dependent dehydrogenase (short-subunit alcohol dehydrogenase family)